MKNMNCQNKKTEHLRIAMFGHKRIPSREGGIEIVVEELAARMVQNGHQVTCYNRSGHHVSGNEFDTKIGNEYQGIKLRKVLTAVSSSFFAALATAFGKYDVVHIHAEGPAAFCWIPKLFGKRVVVTIRGWKDIIWLNQKTPHKYSVLTA